MIKKIISLFLILVLLITTNIPMFASSKHSNFVTRNEFEERMGKIEGKLASLQSNYKSDIGNAIMQFFHDDYNTPFVLTGGVSVATLSYATKNKWQLRSIGNGYKDLTTGDYSGRTFSRKQLLDMVEPNTSKYFYVNMSAGEGTNPTGVENRAFVKVNKMQYGGSTYGTIDYTRNDKFPFRTQTYDNGVTWDQYSLPNQHETIPDYTCSTAQAVAKKEMTVYHYHPWTNGTMMVIKFTNGNSANNITLSENGGPDIPIYFGGNQVSGNTITTPPTLTTINWLPGSTLTMILENTGNQYKPSATDCKWHIISNELPGWTALGRIENDVGTINFPASAGNYSYIILRFQFYWEDNSVVKAVCTRFAGDDVENGVITSWLIDAAKASQTTWPLQKLAIGGNMTKSSLSLIHINCTKDGATARTANTNQFIRLDVYGLTGNFR